MIASKQLLLVSDGQLQRLHVQRWTWVGLGGLRLRGGYTVLAVSLADAAVSFIDSCRFAMSVEQDGHGVMAPHAHMWLDVLSCHLLPVQAVSSSAVFSAQAQQLNSLHKQSINARIVCSRVMISSW